MVAETPIRRAQKATPCAMLPAEAVKTPRASRSCGVRAMTFAAPRILNEPMGCRFSNFRYKFGEVSALHRTSGVRRATDEMFRRASCAWAEVMGIAIYLNRSRARGAKAPFISFRYAALKGRSSTVVRASRLFTFLVARAFEVIPVLRSRTGCYRYLRDPSWRKKKLYRTLLDSRIVCPVHFRLLCQTSDFSRSKCARRTCLSQRLVFCCRYP